MEKILKREDGTSVLIVVDFVNIGHGPIIEIRRVQRRGKNKRKWAPVFDDNDHNYRCLSYEERQKYEYEKQLYYVSKEELLHAKIELWETIKPKLEEN